MANTFISLDDTPISYQGLGGRFLRVNFAEDAVTASNINLDSLDNVQANGVYAPQVGQTLVFHANGQWRPGTLDIYSAGNGLNKSGLTFNVFAGAGGGLTANTQGVFITPIASVAGTYGNSVTVPVLTVNDRGQVVAVEEVTANAQVAQELAADYVSSLSGTPGQISVTGGTGNKSTPTVNLVATGVTAATYGNTTHIPQISVDTYGRITNVDLVEAVAGNLNVNGNVDIANITTTAFRDIVVTGTPNQAPVVADQPHDILTLDAGAGIVITTTASTDTIQLAVDSAAVADTINISQLQGVDISGIADGQAIIWDSANSEFVPGNVVVDLPATGVVAGTYGNATSYPSITVDAQGRITNISNVAFTAGEGGDGNQVLSWNPATSALTISSGNTVNLDSIRVGTLNSISVGTSAPSSGGSLSYNGAGGFSFAPADLAPYATIAYVDQQLSEFEVTGGYGDSNVLLLLSNLDLATEQFVSNSISTATADLATQQYVDDAVANVSVDLTGFATEQFVSDALIGFATEQYVDDAIANIPAEFQTLSFDESTNVLTISGSESTVNFTNKFAQIINSVPGGGGAGTSVEKFRLNYASSGNLSGVAQVSAGINSVNIESTTGGEVTITFNPSIYRFPPSAVIMYGYDYTNNKYWAVPLETSMGLREIAGGGTSGNPTIFDGNGTVELRLRLRETETGAVRGGFGTTTHAWIIFTMFA